MSKRSRQKFPGKQNAITAACSQAQTMRDRQQRGIASAIAIEAERLFPALHAGVFDPEQLMRQASYVLSMVKLHTERHDEGPISKVHTSHILRSLRITASALDVIGVKVPGWRHIKQRHHVDVLRHWERHPPGDARQITWLTSHSRRFFVMIDRPDVVPRGTKRAELYLQSGLKLGEKSAFLVNDYVDWRAESLDASAVFRTITDPGRSISARMMYLWGLSLGEVARWSVVDPKDIAALHIADLDGRRSARDAEFSLDAAVRAEQLKVLNDAWQFCRECGRDTLRPTDEEPEKYAEHVRGVIRHAFEKVLEGHKLTPMQLRDAFFCQVFLDHGGITLKEARQDRSAAASNASLAPAWNEAKRQMGIKGSKAAHANAGLTVKQQRSRSLALQLRGCSDKLGALGVTEAWVGELDAALGTCVIVRMRAGAESAALQRIEQLLERNVLFKLRVLEHAVASDVPPHFSPVLMRRSLAV